MTTPHPGLQRLVGHVTAKLEDDADRAVDAYVARMRAAYEAGEGFSSLDIGFVEELRDELFLLENQLAEEYANSRATFQWRDHTAAVLSNLADAAEAFPELAEAVANARSVLTADPEKTYFARVYVDGERPSMARLRAQRNEARAERDQLRKRVAELEAQQTARDTGGQP